MWHSYICNRLFQTSLYTQCSSRKDFEDHFWHQASLSPSPLLRREWAESHNELCRGAALSWLGSWRMDKPQSPIRQLHLHWPLQFLRFQWPAGKSSWLPALIPAPHRENAALPPPASAGGGGGREKVPGSGEHIWNQLESAECLGKNCRAGRNHSEEPCVQTWLWSKGGGRDVYSILKHKTRAPLGALLFTASSYMSQSCHIFAATGLSRVEEEFSREDWGWEAHSPAEANGTHLWHKY